MLKEYIERRKTHRRIQKLIKAVYSFDDPFSNLDEINKINAELIPLGKTFDLHESLRLQAKADRLGIEIPSDKESWWYRNDAYGFKMNALTQKGRTGARKLIRDERMRRIKQVAELLIPILSLLIAILALTRK